MTKSKIKRKNAIPDLLAGITSVRSRKVHRQLRRFTIMAGWTTEREKKINNDLTLNEIWMDVYIVVFTGVAMAVYPIGFYAVQIEAAEALMVLKVQLGIMIGSIFLYTIIQGVIINSKNWKETVRKSLGTIDYNSPEFLEYLKERRLKPYVHPLTRMDIAARRAYMTLFLTHKNFDGGISFGLKGGFTTLLMLLPIVGCSLSLVSIGTNAPDLNQLLGILPTAISCIVLYLGLWAMGARMLKNFNKVEIQLQEIG
ncbi:MAG: hypothetical protein R3B71_00280 [Candidatus Gracilibacteria bacterium]